MAFHFYTCADNYLSVRANNEKVKERFEEYHAEIVNRAKKSQSNVTK